MRIKNSFILSATLPILFSTSAFALHSDKAQVAHRVVHRHNLAHYQNPNVTSDVNRDAGMYEVKPESAPEYFGHAGGSDGSMPQ